MFSFLVPYLFIALNHLNVNNVPMNEFELPKTWTKDFTINYSFSGSMDGSRIDLKFSYDSCSYTVQRSMNAPQTGAFSMTETYRAEILKKMHELKVNTIKSEMSKYPVDDGYSETLCFGHNCISGGSSATMSDKDKEIFMLFISQLNHKAIFPGHGKIATRAFGNVEARFKQASKEREQID